MKITGVVIEGEKRGKVLGFPTANFEPNFKASEGIYISTTSVDEKLYKSVTFIGIAKTFNAKKSFAESYILDFDKNIYGKKIEVNLIKKIRDNQKFNSEKELIAAVQKDINQTKEYFKNTKTIGIVGGGQLGRMLTNSAHDLGFKVIVIDPTKNSPAGLVADEQILADVKDENAIKKLAKSVDFLTFEVELANAAVLEELTKKGIKINPSAKTLSIIKDKLKQKQFLQNCKIPIADFIEVNSSEDIKKALKKFKLPVLLKARMDAYDGRGNALIKSEEQIDAALEKLTLRLNSGKSQSHPEKQSDEGSFYVEKFVPFIKECAVVVARSIKGEIITYPVVETVHKNNICIEVLSPAPFSKNIQKKAQNLAKKVMENLDGAGVFGIEMFLTSKGQVLINEIAPRVHNSGHFTIEATKTSQFEQHIRAVTGMDLGPTEMIVPAAVMVNILGERVGKAEVKGLEKALKIPDVSVHIYGKLETKLERKMGHITAVSNNLKTALENARKARRLISI